eukprot:1029463-Rhodomonas_salina.1
MRCDVQRSDRGGGIRGTPLYSAPEKLKRGQEERRGGHGTIVSRSVRGALGGGLLQTFNHVLRRA